MNLFLVKRAFWLDGLMHSPGETLAIARPDDLNVLLASGKVSPANAETEANIRSKTSTEWVKDTKRSDQRLRFIDPL